MSIFVDEILNSIYNEKDKWSKYCKYNFAMGIKKDNIIIDNFGNSRILSVICVLLDNEQMPITYTDRFRLEVAVKWWYKNIDLNNLRSK